MEKTDFLVIGGGVMGLTLAIEIKCLYSDSRVMLIEKETDFGLHASGRNSGVIHAGFYYSENSLKARFTRDGNILLREYCLENGLKINQCGKLVVCQNESHIDDLRELKRRGDKNAVELDWLSEQEAKEIEPMVRTVEAALWSPTTATIDPYEVVKSLVKKARQTGVDVKSGIAYRYSNKNSRIIQTTKGKIEAGYVVNAAGLYADKIALDYGFSKRYRIIPFKGLYLYATNKTPGPRVHIYPVPDLHQPFLGVHFTLSVEGDVKIGPTAIPALWRENYSGLQNFRLDEFTEIVFREAQLFFNNTNGFRNLAFEEIKKYQKQYIINQAAELMDGTNEMKFEKWGRPGIRAQLIDIENKSLEMDFIYEGDNKSFHLLNAVSPAFTCSFAFSKYLVGIIEKKLSPVSSVR